MTAQEIKVLISADASKFKSELNAVKGSLASLQAGASTTGSAVGGGMFASMLKANIATALLTAGLVVLTKGIEAIGNTISESITTTQKFEGALIGLETVAGRKLGFSAIKDANQTAKDLASDGLMAVTDSATGLKNLLASGFNLEEANNLMLVFKDSASFGRQSALSFGQAVSSATEGIKNGNSILVDNAGITKNLSNILVEAGYSQQDLSRATSDAGVRQALYNGLLKEGNLFQGDSAKLANTSAGQMAQLEASIINLQVSVGQAIKPIQMALNEGVLAFLKGMQLTINGASLNVANFTQRVAGVVLAFIRVIGRLLSSLPVIGKNFVGMANASLGVSKAQDKLTTSTNNSGKAIKNTTDKAKELKKELMGLASFDEMNVLNTPATASGTSSDIGATGGAGNVNPLAIDSSTFDTQAVNDYADKVTGAFQAIGDKINLFLQPIIKALGEAWEWLNKNIIQPVVAFWNRELMPIFEYLGKKVQEVALAFIVEWIKIEPVVTPLFNAIKKLAEEGFKRLGEIISFIWENALKPFAKWFIDTLVYNIKTGIENIGKVIRFLDPIFTGVINFISGLLNWLWNAIKDVMKWIAGAIADVGFFLWKAGNSIKDAFEGIGYFLMMVWAGIQVAFKTGVNFVIDRINDIIKAVNKGLEAISKMSTAMGGKSIDFRVGTIPHVMAKGGIVDSPTVAMIGEAGKEAVVPLENNMEWVDMLASKINDKGQGGNITVYLGEEKIYSKFVDYVNDKSRASNSLILNI